MRGRLSGLWMVIIGLNAMKIHGRAKLGLNRGQRPGSDGASEHSGLLQLLNSV
jgi:hypothetical protein